MKNKAKERNGQKYETNCSGILEIVDYVNARNVYVRFVETNFKTKASMSQIVAGSVKDWSIPSVHGVGIVGEERVTLNGRHDKAYGIWVGMLRRCYNKKELYKFPTYEQCITSDDFKIYKKFKSWCLNQKGFDQEGWHLDKDILVKGNKIYSEETCCFVPREVNSLFIKAGSTRGSYPIGVSYHKKIGKFTANLHRRTSLKNLGAFTTKEDAFIAYKTHKEAYIKSVAEKWKGEIDDRVYEALMKYEVGFDD